MMMIGIGTPSNQSRIGIHSSLQSTRHEPAFIPRAIAMLSAFDRCKARGEGTEKKRGRHPERQFHCVQSSTIKSILRFLDDIVDPLLRISVAHAGLLTDEVSDIGSIRWLEAVALGEA
jgi:hypothetical protein